MDGPQKHRRFLVILHEASRSGAPLVCLYFLRWLKRSRQCSFDILFLRGGELEKEFSLVGPMRKIPWYIGKHWRMPLGLRWLFPRGRQLLLWSLRGIGIRYTERHRVRREGYDCVICNSLAAVWCLRDLVSPGTPTLLWAHELEYAITCLSLPPMKLRSALHSVQRIIACGRAVRDNLVENHGVWSAIVDTTTEFVEQSSIVVRDRSSRPTLLPDIPPGAFIITTVAWIQWRKGPDLFLRMARHLPREIDGRPLHFVWVGAETVPGMIDDLLKRAESAGLIGRMHFLGERQNPTEIVSVSDVFVLSSREDPYPLVMIEAALVYCPIVGFAGSGGAEEFLAGDAGVLVPYGDAVAMANAVDQLLRHPDEAKACAEKAYAKALLHTSEHSAEKIYEACVKTMA